MADREDWTQDTHDAHDTYGTPDSQDSQTPHKDTQSTGGAAGSPEENGCTYHSGRMEGFGGDGMRRDPYSGGYRASYRHTEHGTSGSSGTQGADGRFTGRGYDAQGNSRSFGTDYQNTGDDYRNADGNYRYTRSDGSGYGMNEKGEYRYSYEDYNRISYDPEGGDGGSGGKNGIKVFAVTVTVLLVVTAAVLTGVLLSSRDGGTEDSSLTLSSEVSGFSQSDVSEGVSSDLESGADISESREEAKVPELNITSHVEEDTYISTDGRLTTNQVHEKVRPSVVGILNYAVENTLTAASSGSGIIISSDGYILTNAHVINGAVGLIVVLDNDEEYAATLVGCDTSTDLAVIKIEAENLTAAELGDSDQLKVGEKVIAIGNPAGLNLAGSTTQGIVSGLERTISVTLDSGESISMEVIQTDAAINPGNSGGPLINEYGQVIGINSSRLSSSSYDGIGFAIPINNALPVVEDLIRYGYVTGRVRLGITYYPISEVVGAMSGYTPGLLVYSVDTTMDIYLKGVRAGDIITEMDGKPVMSKEEINAVLDGKEPGDSVTLTFVRGSGDSESEYTVTVLLGEDTGNSDTGNYSTETGTGEGVPTAGTVPESRAA